jgi:hypothetical protein
MWTSPVTTRMKRLTLRGAGALALALSMAGCGGGLYLDVSDPYVGPPPSISLTASTGIARRGDLIRLSAAVSAPNGIDRITFYRIDPGVSTSLGLLYGPPAQLDTPIPINAGGSVGYWAKVCDQAGYCSESATVTVSVVN